MNATLIAVGVLALGVTALVALGALFVQKWLRPLLDLVVGRYMERPIRLLDERIKQLESDVDELPKKWDDIRDASKKLRDRATYHTRRVRAELGALDLADPELDAIADSLRGANGEGEPEGELPLVLADVAEASEEDEMTRALKHKWANRGL